MIETLTATTLAGISYYGLELDIGNFGWNWANRGHETSLDIFLLFQQEIIGWVIFAGRGNNGNAACHLDKERLMWV